jgi:hypothetical protein
MDHQAHQGHQERLKTKIKSRFSAFVFSFILLGELGGKEVCR